MITIVFGKPGAGKTAFMVANALPFMNYSQEMYDLRASCVAQVEALNAEGRRFTAPLWAPVYSNFPIVVPCGSYAPVESYYIDGFRLGFENEDVEVYSVLPGAKIFLSEAQRYYNSRRSKDLPDWVSRFYEEHRHFGLDIFLDVQRPGLIDLNIRELCGCFIEVEHMENLYDGIGNIVRSDFTLNVFSDWRDVDHYLTTGEMRGNKQKISYNGCLFDYYESTCYYKEFVPISSDFSTVRHLLGGTDDETIRRSKEMYLQTPPDGFYGTKKNKSVKKNEVENVREFE